MATPARAAPAVDASRRASLDCAALNALSSPLTPLASLATLAYAAAQALLLVYSAHRWTLLFGRRSALLTPPPFPEWPRVTVQLPLYNEAAVVERLIDQVARMDYPPDRLEIQVLDDSTDETSVIAARAIGRARERGLRIHHLRRDTREGYKAGALRAGFEAAAGELLAVLDADFLPPEDFLRRLVPHFRDPTVGMAQARWTHLNRDASALTAAQAVLLDAHFVLEHGRRMSRGHFLNFNGSAGVWRRSCIEEAGGWSHATLTEDLDLSYRAQLAGWRFIYDGGVEAPAELPSNIAALKSQQARWVKGSIQTARRVLPELLGRRLPIGQKAEAVLHLTGNAAYPALLALAALLLPVLLAARPWPAAGILHGVVLALGVLPVALALAAAQRALGRPPSRIAADVALAIALGVGLSFNNARAVLEGLGGEVGVFERTPKTGGRGAVEGRAARWGWPRTPAGFGAVEAVLAVYFVGVAGVAVAVGDLRAVPFALVLAAGFGFVGSGWRGGGARAAL